MEVLANFLVPKEDAIELEYNKIHPITQGRDEEGNLTTNYKGRSYENVEDAYATQAVVAAVLEDRDPEEIQRNMELILNPPEGIDLTHYAFDVDLTPAQQALPTFLPNFENYVAEVDYQNSCPHHEIDHYRIVDRGVISCFLNKISIYKKLIDWYNQGREYRQAKIPSILPDDDYNDEVPFNANQQLLIRKILSDIPGNPVLIFQKYCYGINKKYHLNSLTRDKLQFLYNSGRWANAPLLIVNDLMKEINYRLKALKALFDNPGTDKFLIVFSLVAKYEDNVDIQNFTTLIKLLGSYYEGILEYSSRIFDLTTGLWLMEGNTRYALPTVKGTVVTDISKIDISDKFFTIVNALNALNIVA